MVIRAARSVAGERLHGEEMSARWAAGLSKELLLSV
jgi:hypothetical protein